MGTVVTVMNMKGGVGKTTVTMHLGGMIALYSIGDKERSVLLIDYDPQFNLTQAFIPDRIYFQLEKARKTTLSILLDDDTDIDPYHLQVPGNMSPPKVRELSYKLYDRLDIIPSTLDLMYLALGQPEKRIKPFEERFDKFIAQCREHYDLILIDCHPAGSLFTKTALTNSDHVLIPVAPQRYAIRGIGLMLQFIEAKKLGASPVPHILFNMTAGNEISAEEKEIRNNPKFGGKCLRSTLKKYKVFSDPLEGNGFVWETHSKSRWSREAFDNIESVTKEFLSKI
ncbi:MAG: hypothetical protein DRI57_16345 [Deltaproteobacteria bacterium]|nr:MAG: hypothetical protein DRI57_16345 [Deltaproteobacteria bacterium]